MLRIILSDGYILENSTKCCCWIHERPIAFVSFQLLHSSMDLTPHDGSDTLLHVQSCSMRRRFLLTLLMILVNPDRLINQLRHLSSHRHSLLTTYLLQSLLCSFSYEICCGMMAIFLSAYMYFWKGLVNSRSRRNEMKTSRRMQNIRVTS